MENFKLLAFSIYILLILRVSYVSTPFILVRFDDPPYFMGNYNPSIKQDVNPTEESWKVAQANSSQTAEKLPPEFFSNSERVSMERSVDRLVSSPVQVKEDEEKVDGKSLELECEMFGSKKET